MVSQEEIKRVLEISSKKPCTKCKIGKYVVFIILGVKVVICDNCGKNQ